MEIFQCLWFDLRFADAQMPSNTMRIINNKSQCRNQRVTNPYFQYINYLLINTVYCTQTCHSFISQNLSLITKTRK